MSIRTNPASGGAAERALTRLITFADPPVGPLYSADLVAALGEGSLLPREEVRLVADIRRSPAARNELRELYPERFEAIFEQRPSGMARVLRFPRKRMAVAGALVAALAATLAIVLIPPAPPSGGEMSILTYHEVLRRGGDSITRGGDADVLRTGERFQAHLALGRLGWLDRMRGAGLWAGLFRVDTAGHASLAATTEDPGAGMCTVSEQTMACVVRAGERPGLEHLVFVTASRPPDTGTLRSILGRVNAVPAPTARGAALRAALRAEAADRPWRVSAYPPIEIKAPR